MHRSASNICRAVAVSAIAAALAHVVFACNHSASNSEQQLSAADEREPNTSKLTLTGSSTIAPLIAEIAKRYEALHPGVRVDVQTGGSSRGLADVQKGLADIGMVSRAPKNDEATGLTWHEIARDGIALIVHSTSPVQRLSAEQVVSLYTGKITSWTALGGPEGKPVIVHKAEGRSTLELFLQHFRIDSKQVMADVVIGDNQQGIKTVAGNPLAVGYVSIGSAEAERDRGVTIKLVDAGDVAASTAAVAAGKYPIARPLNLITSPDSSRAVDDFVAFAVAESQADLVKKEYFVPVSR